MMLRSRRMLRFAVPLTVVWLMSACADGDREQPLSRVETIDIPVADTTTTVNINIANPSLTIPDTFQVSDGDLLTLVWNDEFDGAKLDPEVWFFESGDGSQYDIPGWGNNELQWYLPDNASLEDGKLKITAKRESVGDFGFTSARINTADRFAFKYGRIEASIKMPSGQGFLPAFWMLSQDSDYLCNGEPCVWAATGEIDIVEAANLGGTGGNEIFGTIHYGPQFVSVASSETYTPSVDITEGFHTYALEWDEDEIRWYFDGLLYAMQNSWYSDADGEDFPAPFNQNFHVLLNLAVGGNNPGDPDGTTPFPATMEVDWVRVYSGEDPDDGVALEPNVSAPTPTEDPADVVSLFSDAYDDIVGIDYNPAWGQVTEFALAQIAGNKMLKYANLDYQGIDFAGNPQDVSDKGFLHIDVWTADSTALNVYLISAGPVEAAYAIPVAPNSWVSVDIPLTEFDGVDLTNLIQLKFDGNGTVFLDNLYFAGEAPVTAPEEAAPPPTADPGVVISLFSDAYTNIADIDYNPNWGQATVVTQEDIAGNNTLKYAGLNYQGMDFSANPQDVSGLVSLHLDFWTADSTALNVYLISTDGAETPYELTIAPESWVSVDIPLTEFAGVNLANVHQLKFDGNGTIFLDNLYFEGAAAPTEPVVAPTPPTADAGAVTSVFSNAYDPAGNFNYNPNWGQATIATIETIAGNDVWKLAGLNYQGIDFVEFGGPALDVSGYDTLHIDYWSADATTLNVFLISPAGETPYNIPIVTGSWQSVDIPLSAFAGVDLTNVIQMKFDDNGTGEAATFFIDNIYFYTAGGSGGGVEIAVNGGFESGDFTGWTQFESTPGNQTVNTGMAGDTSSEGVYHLEINNVTTDTNSLVKQERVGVGVVTPGAAWTVTFDARGSVVGGGVAFAQVFSEIAGGSEPCDGCGILGGAPLALNGDPTVWTPFSFSGTAGPNTESLTLQLEAVAGAGSANVFYDNISIVVADGGGGGGTATGGTVPDATILEADGSTADLAATFTGFDSGTGTAFVADSSYAQALEVTVADGYAPGALNLAQLFITGLSSLDSYESFYSRSRD